MITNQLGTRRFLFASLVTTLLTGASAAHAQTALTWKFKPGESLRYAADTDMKQTMNVQGMDISTTMTQGLELTWTVKSVDGGKAQVVQKIDRFRQKMEAPFGGFEYDSKEGKPASGPIGQIAGPIFEAMLDSEFSFRMDAQGEVTDTKVSETLLEALKKAPGAAQMGGMFSEEGMKNMMQQSAVSFPKEPLTAGKTWNKSVDVKLPFGTMKMATTYTYKGPENRNGAKLERIDTKSNVTIQPAEGANITLNIKSADVTGAIYFDNNAGHIVESNQDMKMAMDVSAMGQTFQSNQDQTTTMKLLPAAASK